MRLNKMYDIWSDLEQSYSSSDKTGISRLVYLKNLLMCDDKGKPNVGLLQVLLSSEVNSYDETSSELYRDLVAMWKKYSNRLLENRDAQIDDLNNFLVETNEEIDLKDYDIFNKNRTIPGIKALEKSILGNYKSGRNSFYLELDDDCERVISSKAYYYRLLTKHSESTTDFDKKCMALLIYKINNNESLDFIILNSKYAVEAKSFYKFGKFRVKKSVEDLIEIENISFKDYYGNPIECSLSFLESTIKFKNIDRKVVVILNVQ